jgi:hypothetical protein
MNVEPINSASYSTSHNDYGASAASSSYSNGSSSDSNYSDSSYSDNSYTPEPKATVATEPESVQTNGTDSQASTTASEAKLVEFLLKEFQDDLPLRCSSIRSVLGRLATEVERICSKSDRIQNSGQIQSWKITLARHRVQKCLTFYRLGSRRGRVELHSNLSAMVYRQIAPPRANLGFQGRYELIEDFLQGFYIESLKAFRRENALTEEYSPQTRLELAEYMAFTDHYAKRRISLPGRRSQQLIVLRAQGFANRQPQETAMDIELAMESSKGDDTESYNRSPMMQQLRDQMVADAVDPSESVLRDRVIRELIDYLKAQNQFDCVDYLTLKLQDLSVPEIDDILGLTARQRDYLQQRFKYHVEKFARSHRWQLVHQWLGADLDQNLGMSLSKWETFIAQLSPEQRTLLEMKVPQLTNQDTLQYSDQDIAKALNCTPKQVQKRWVKLLDLAWQFRNQSN